MKFVTKGDYNPQSLTSKAVCWYEQNADGSSPKNIIGRCSKETGISLSTCHSAYWRRYAKHDRRKRQNLQYDDLKEALELGLSERQIAKYLTGKLNQTVTRNGVRIYLKFYGLKTKGSKGARNVYRLKKKEPIGCKLVDDIDFFYKYHQRKKLFFKDLESLVFVRYGIVIIDDHVFHSVLNYLREIPRQERTKDIIDNIYCVLAKKLKSPVFDL